MTRTHLALATLATLGLAAAHPAAAQDSYFGSKATINYSINGKAVVGFANANDYNNGVNGTSPTVSLVSGGSTSNDLITNNGSTTYVTGGSIGYYLIGFDSSTINFSGGSAAAGSYTYNSSTLNASGGSFGTTVAGNDNSTINFSGGSASFLQATNSAIVNLSGGMVRSGFTASRSSTVTVSGGSVGTDPDFGVNFRDSTSGAFTFIGTGLSAVATGTDPGLGGTDYRLTGLLQNGQSVTGDTINVQPGAAMFVLAPAATPEPSQLAALAVGLLGLSALALRARRRRPLA